MEQILGLLLKLIYMFMQVITDLHFIHPVKIRQWRRIVLPSRQRFAEILNASTDLAFRILQQSMGDKHIWNNFAKKRLPDRPIYPA